MSSACNAWGPNGARCEIRKHHDAAGPEDGCPIILQLLLGEPTEHVGRGPDWSPQTVAWCSQCEKRPKWHGEVVGDVVSGGLLVLIVDTEDDAEQSEHWDGTTPWESDALDGECAVGDTCECDDPDHHPCGCGRVPEQCDECGGAK